MVLLFAYFLINCIISLFLERKKYKTATVAHVILFTFLLVGLLLSGKVLAVVPALNHILGDSVVALLQKSIIGTYGTWLAPMLVLEIATIFLTIIACAITVVHIAEVLSSGKNIFQQTNSTKRHQTVTSADEIVIAKKFMLKCSYLC